MHPFPDVRFRVWTPEKTTKSHDLGVALQLARLHLPIVATLPPPVLYTASDQVQGHIGGYGRSPSAGAPSATTLERVGKVSFCG